MVGQANCWWPHFAKVLGVNDSWGLDSPSYRHFFRISKMFIIAVINIKTGEEIRRYNYSSHPSYQAWTYIIEDMIDEGIDEDSFELLDGEEEEYLQKIYKFRKNLLF